MLANINKNNIIIIQNLAGNTGLLSLVPLTQIIQHAQEKNHEEPGFSTTLFGVPFILE